MFHSFNSNEYIFFSKVIAVISLLINIWLQCVMLLLWLAAWICKWNTPALAAAISGGGRMIQLNWTYRFFDVVLSFVIYLIIIQCNQILSCCCVRSLPILGMGECLITGRIIICCFIVSIKKKQHFNKTISQWSFPHNDWWNSVG